VEKAEQPHTLRETAQARGEESFIRFLGVATLQAERFTRSPPHIKEARSAGLITASNLYAQKVRGVKWDNPLYTHAIRYFSHSDHLMSTRAPSLNNHPLKYLYPLFLTFYNLKPKPNHIACAKLRDLSLNVGRINQVVNLS
jgi:hypothetical protein